MLQSGDDGVVKHYLLFNNLSLESYECIAIHSGIKWNFLSEQISFKACWNKKSAPEKPE